MFKAVLSMTNLCDMLPSYCLVLIMVDLNIIYAQKPFKLSNLVSIFQGSL